MDWTYFLPCLWAFLACAGFCVIFNIRTGVLICCFGGALGWLVYLLTMLAFGNDLVCNFLAAMAISLYSEIMARIRKCPVTGYLLVSFFPLVPGAGIYYTMQYVLQGDTEMFVQSGLHILGIAGCLALGVLVMSSVVRMVITFRKNRRPK
ncbi:MAG: threonine/serine exporter family protein [Oscillospiraceae bacterium]